MPGSSMTGRGDPTKENSPILSRIAYGSIEYFRKPGQGGT